VEYYKWHGIGGEAMYYCRASTFIVIQNTPIVWISTPPSTTMSVQCRGSGISREAKVIGS